MSVGFHYSEKSGRWGQQPRPGAAVGVRNMGNENLISKELLNRAIFFAHV